MCYHSLFDDSILRNPSGALGYGYDRCFAAHCGGKEGILLGHAAYHFQNMRNRDRPWGSMMRIPKVPPLQGRRLNLGWGLNQNAELQGRRVVAWVEARSLNASRRLCAARGSCHGPARTRLGRAKVAFKKCPVEVLLEGRPVTLTEPQFRARLARAIGAKTATSLSSSGAQFIFRSHCDHT